MSGQWPPEWEDEDDVFGTEAGQPAAEDDARQAEVAAFLASVPAPDLPAGIQSRISASIAAEAASRAAGGAPGASGAEAPEVAETDGNRSAGAAGAGDGEPGGVRPLGPAPARARRRRRPGGGPGQRGGSRRHRGPGQRTGLYRRFLQFGPVLAIVVIVAGLGYVISLAGSSSSSSSSAAGSAAGAASSAAAAAPEAGASSRSGPAAGSAPSAQAPNPAVTAPGHPGPLATPLFTVTESGTKYRQATLGGQVRGTLAALGTTTGKSFATGPRTPALAGCVLHLTGGPSPRLVDRATYQGTAAYVIASSSHIWVVGTGCTAADPQLIESVPLAG